MDRMPSIDSLLASSASLMQYMRIIWIIHEYKYIALHYSALHLYSALHYTVYCIIIINTKKEGMHKRQSLYIIQCIALYMITNQDTHA